MKINDKIKEMLSEADLKDLEKDITELVNEKVELRVSEILKDLDQKADEFCEKQIAEAIEKEKVALIESYDEKLEALEESIVEKVDKFLASEISEQISDEAINKIAINETYAPIIESIQKLFEEKYVALDTQGVGVLAEKTKEVDSLKEQVSQLIADKMELKEAAEEATIRLFVSEKTKDLTESQILRVKTFFEDKSFDEVQKKIDSFIELVNESTEDTSKKETIQENNSNSDGDIVVENEKKDAEALDESVKNNGVIVENEETNSVQVANKYL